MFAFAYSLRRISATVLAIVGACFLQIRPALALDTTQDLHAAIADGTVSVEAQCIEPRRLKLDVTNRTAEPRRIVLGSGTLAWPASEPRPTLPKPPEKSAEIQELMKLAKQVASSQVGAIAGRDGRGGYGGLLILKLAPGETFTVTVPFLATELKDYRPDPNVRYALGKSDPASDPAVRLLLAELTQRGATFGVAQAALWHLMHGIPLRQLRLLKLHDINDEEIVLAEHLVSEVRQAVEKGGRKPSPVPARVYLEVINKAGAGASTLAAELERLMETGGFLGLPVTMGNVEEAPLSTPAQLATAIGCQLTIGGTPEKLTAHVAIARWDGRVYRVHRDIRVELGTAPEPKTVAVKIETELLQNLIELRRASPINPGTMHGVEVINHFPLALTSLHLRRRAESTAASHELTLTGYDIGPRRRLTIDLDSSAFSLEVIGAAWGQ